MATEEKSEDSELGHDQTSLGHVRTKRIRRRTGFPLELTSLPNEIRREKTENKINENSYNLEENLNLEAKPPTMREKSPSELNQKQSTSNRKNSQRKVKYNPPVNTRLTPMGLPKPSRLAKNAPITVEDIYEQKDYRTPTQSKALPTILDDNHPKVVDGETPFSKVKRKRIIPFAAHPEDRKQKKRKSLKVRQSRRKRGAILDEKPDLDERLREKLAKLDNEMKNDSSDDATDLNRTI